MSMFCYQCQETAKGTGCTIKGVCGKDSETAGMQDLLVYSLKGLAIVENNCIDQKIEISDNSRIYMESLFVTITNANFDEKSIRARVATVLEAKQLLIDKLSLKGIDISNLGNVALWNEAESEWAAKATIIGILSTKNEDVRSLRELITYGLKGVAAYAEHADNLGKRDPKLTAFVRDALAKTVDDSLSADDLVALTLETGAKGVEVMALLDEANTSRYGSPEMTEVNIGVRDNPAILISGHDLRDLEDLLEQTDGTGVDVYTHSEMLPAHYYPAFKKFNHFVGNYGNAWWKQKAEFKSFRGPILFTTNCIVPPTEEALTRIYTTGTAGYPGAIHIADRANNEAKDFSAIIEQAKTLPSPIEIETGTIIGGFAHAQVFALADKVVDAVKSGAIKQFFVMAGCDGRMKGREYYTEFAQKLPEDTVILTAGCAKYRYNKLKLGDIGGIPRVLDAGQCNDSYSLAVIALKLKEIFELNDINDLPISYNIAWYEQKAVIVLLALLSLGVKDIHLGPTLPAFLSPNVADILIKTFGIAGIGEVESDIATFLA